MFTAFSSTDDEVPGFFTGDGAVFTHNCFGYLSYRNAKFGKIDSHIAVCGYARRTLLQAMRLAEERDYRVIHGIVDSLWLSRPGATREDYLELCDRIKEETGFKIVTGRSLQVDHLSSEQDRFCKPGCEQIFRLF